MTAAWLASTQSRNEMDQSVALRARRLRVQHCGLMASKSASFWHLPWRYGLFLLLCLSAVPLAVRLGVQSGIMAAFDLAALVLRRRSMPSSRTMQTRCVAMRARTTPIGP